MIEKMTKTIKDVRVRMSTIVRPNSFHWFAGDVTPYLEFLSRRILKLHMKGLHHR